jgi:CheY-like chemotaxis protein
MLLQGDVRPVPLDKNLVFLVVDDFETMRRVTVNQLRQLGAEKILMAKDGREALKILKSQTVHVVLSDWNMPVMTGMELLREVRADDKLFVLPFLMITAEADRARVQEAIDGGVTCVLLKPYSTNQLLERLQAAFAWKPRKVVREIIVHTVAAPQRATAPAADSAQERSSIPALEFANLAGHTQEKPTILVVDDAPDNLILLSQLLKDHYRIKLAQNGQKALEICSADRPPDLVLLDIMMPDMDGFEVARRMREHPNSETIPVIFVTAMTGEDARERGLDLGAVDFITKPIDPNQLKLRVRNFMRYVNLRKTLQADYDSMLEVAQLREDVERITRHDIKGPLAGVMGLVQGLLAKNSLSAEDRQQLALVEETALLSINMINLSFELFKIETGRFALQATPVAIGDILRRCVEISRAAFSSKGLRITVEADTSPGAKLPMAWGDATLCHSIFQNLIKNACEASPDGGTVSVRLQDQSPLRIAIRNPGSVPAAIRERFFEKYVSSGKPGGTGLGTYSARLLARAQGGEVELAVSDIDNSTVLTVSLIKAKL